MQKEEPEGNVRLYGNGKRVRCKAAPYGSMQNGSHGEKEKGRESKAKDKMMETEGDKLSRSVWTGGDQDFGKQG